MGWLQRKQPRYLDSDSPIRKTATYIITPYSDPVGELANATAADQRTAIDEERRMRAENRAERTRAWRQERHRGGA